MKKRLFSLIAVVALVSLSALAFAAPKAGAKAGPDPYGLTTEKRAAIQKIIESHQDKLYELREKIWAKHAELQALTASGKAEKGDIQSLIGDISKLRNAMHQERQAIRTEIEKETGIKAFGPRGYHRGLGGGYNCDGDSGCTGGGAGGGYGHGFGRGQGMMMGGQGMMGGGY